MAVTSLHTAAALLRAHACAIARMETTCLQPSDLAGLANGTVPAGGSSAAGR
jgi:hypothetical protein